MKPGTKVQFSLEAREVRIPETYNWVGKILDKMPVSPDPGRWRWVRWPDKIVQAQGNQDPAGEKNVPRIWMEPIEFLEKVEYESLCRDK